MPHLGRVESGPQDVGHTPVVHGWETENGRHHARTPPGLSQGRADPGAGAPRLRAPRLGLRRLSAGGMCCTTLVPLRGAGRRPEGPTPAGAEVLDGPPGEEGGWQSQRPPPPGLRPWSSLQGAADLTASIQPGCGGHQGHGPSLSSSTFVHNTDWDPVPAPPRVTASYFSLSPPQPGTPERLTH